MIKRRLLLVFASVALLLCLPAPPVGTAEQGAIFLPPPASAIAVYFSPRGGCTAAIVAEIAAAKRSVHVQAYSFTSPVIASALVDARRRGVDVRVLIDAHSVAGRGCQAARLATAGCEVKIDAAHAIAHNKVMVIDSATVLAGSFNWTAQAEDRNAENLLVIRDAALAQRYAIEWAKHAGHSTAFKPNVVLPLLRRKAA